MTSTFSIADLMTCTNSARQAGRYILILRVLCGAIAAAQPVVSVVPPVQLDLGIGGGMSLPTGDLNNTNNTGWHVNGLVRLHGFMPLSVVASGSYHRLPNAGGITMATLG